MTFHHIADSYLGPRTYVYDAVRFFKMCPAQ